MTNLEGHKVVTTEETGAVRNVIEALLKAKKNLRIYPKNNPVYISNMENVFNAFRDCFQYDDKLTFRFSQNDIYYNSESVYNNPQKQENLALLFFKDGIQEITFFKDVTSDEIEDCIEIIASDFDRSSLEDDVVTLFWQRDFKNIEYVAEDIVLTGEDVDESHIIHDLKQKSPEPADLKSAFDDSFKEGDDLTSVPLIALTADDYKQLVEMSEKDGEEKLTTFINMLFEIASVEESPDEFEEIVYFFMRALDHVIKAGNFRLMTDVLVKLKKIISDKDTSEELRESAIKIILFVSGKKMIDLIGDMLDNNEEIEKDVFREFICLLDENAISPLVNLLGVLKGMTARRAIIDALIALGPKDILKLITGLKHPKWYVVRNIIYILSRVEDPNAIEHIKKTLKHEDFRVRREAVRALGQLGKDNVLGTLLDGLNDNDIKVRKASLVAIGNIATDSAKKVIMQRISDSSFVEKELNEKKDYFGILARWKDNSSYDLCIKTIMKKSFWNKSKNYETKACCAYGLGLIGNENALPILNKFKTTRNRVLNEFTNEAIKRIESGR